MLINSSIAFVIPCYNEEKRIKNLLDAIIIFKKESYKNYNINFIIVNDGSNDLTLQIISKHSIFKKNYFECISYSKNQGKGFALMKGVEASKNHWIVTIDVDLSVTLEGAMKKFINNYEESIKIYYGSRSHPQSKVISKKYRNLIGLIFVYLTKYLLKLKITDTQCGFKIYDRKIFNAFLNKFSSFGYTLDLELSILCAINNIIIKEIPVNWTHKPGSTINLLIDPIKMFLNILQLKKKYKI